MSTEPIQAKSQEGKLEEVSVLSTLGLIVGVLGMSSAILVCRLCHHSRYHSNHANQLNLCRCRTPLYGITDWSKLTRVASGRSTPLIILEVVLVIGVLLTTVAINYFSRQSSKEWDLTRDRLYTLQEQSLDVIKRLDTDIQIIGVYQPNDNRRAQLQELVDLTKK